MEEVIAYELSEAGRANLRQIGLCEFVELEEKIDKNELSIDEAYQELGQCELIKLVDGSHSRRLAEYILSVLFDLENQDGEDGLSIVEGIEEIHREQVI